MTDRQEQNKPKQQVNNSRENTKKNPELINLEKRNISERCVSTPKEKGKRP